MIDLVNELKPVTPSALLLEIDYVTEVVQSKWFDSYLEALDHCDNKYKIPQNGWCICGETLDEGPWGFSNKLKYLVDETLTLWLVIPLSLKPGEHFPLPCSFCK
jgi:hypothetical protein